MSNITNCIKKVGEVIYRYKFTIICAIYFCIITYVATQMILQGAISKPSMLHALSILLFLNIFAKIRNNIISGILTVFLAYFISLDAYFAYIYGSPILPGMMASIFETNSAEATEALKDAAVISIIIFAATTTLLFLARKELRTLNFSIKKSLLVLLVYWVIVMPSVIYRKLAVNDSLMGEFRLYPVETVRTLIGKHFPLVYNNFATLAAYKYEMQKLKNYVSSERRLPEGISLDRTLNTPDKIYFIIGESSYRKHYSLYGYHLPTTPFLDSLLLTSPDKLSYYNGIAPATLTRDATRMILTFSSTSDIDTFFEYKNMEELARGNGYETIWLSNQGHTTKEGSYIGCVIENVDQRYFESGSVREDLDLATKAKEKYKEGKKQFFFIHLNGSHLSYPERYDDKDRIAITDGSYPTLDYDRTIHHTDRVIKEISELALRDSSSLVYYLPDHGEIIGTGHGFMSESTAQFQVPVIIFNNSIVPVNDIVTKYVDKNTTFINTTNTIYIIAEILGYNIAPSVSKKALEDGLNVLNADGKVYPFLELWNNDKLSK